MQNTTRYAELDGLRGIAAFVVLLSHCAFAFWPTLHRRSVEDAGAWETWVANSPFSVVYNGTFAVYVFFVISGFVLSVNFWKAESDYTVRAMALRRYTRLAVPILGSVLVAYAIWKLDLFFNTQAEGLAWFQRRYFLDPSEVSLLVALWEGIAGALIEGNNTFNFVLWTMQIEFFGSFLVFATCILTKDLRLRGVIYTAQACIILMLLGPSGMMYVCFLIGMWLAECSNSGKWPAWLCILILIISLYLGGYKAQSAAHEPLRYLYISVGSLKITPTAFCYSIGAAGLVLVASKFQWLHRILSSSPSSFLGKISFSLYLLHSIILCSLGAFIFVTLREPIGATSAAAIASSATIVVSLIAANAFSMVDRSAMSFSKLVARQFLRTAPPATA